MAKLAPSGNYYREERETRDPKGFVDKLQGLPIRHLVPSCSIAEWDPYDPTPAPKVKWIPSYAVSGSVEVNPSPGIPLSLHPVEQKYITSVENLSSKEKHYLYGKHYRFTWKWPFVKMTIGHPDIQPVPLWDEKDLV